MGINYRMPNDKRFQDLTGRVFGRLTVLKFQHTLKARSHWWICRCSCGTVKSINGDCLRDGHSLSCGCLRSELVSAKNLVHDMSKTKTYRCYHLMLKRCYDKSNKRYARYGKRGIIVCDRWRKSFLNFLEDMGESPGKEFSIERVNNDGNYEPNNCIWATAKMQARNKSNNKIIQYRGESKPLAEWCEVLNLPYFRMKDRFRLGWSPEKAFETPKLRLSQAKR